MSDDLSIHHSFTKDGNGENNGNSTKPPVFDLERQATTTTTRPAYTTPAPKSLGSGVSSRVPSLHYINYMCMAC